MAKQVNLFELPFIPIYWLICCVASFPLLLVTVPMGLSVGNDKVFASFVIFGGTLGDWIFRKIFDKKMMLIGQIPMVAIWPIIGLAVFFLEPLSG